MTVQVQGFETLHRTTGKLPWVPFEPYNERVGVKLLETAGSQHTFIAEPGDDVEAFIVLEGALQFLGRTARRLESRTGRRSCNATAPTARRRASRSSI